MFGSRGGVELALKTWLRPSHTSRPWRLPNARVLEGAQSGVREIWCGRDVFCWSASDGEKDAASLALFTEGCE